MALGLDVDPAAGLTPDEAARRLITVGENRLAEHKTWSARDDSDTRW